MKCLIYYQMMTFSLQEGLQRCDLFTQPDLPTFTNSFDWDLSEIFVSSKQIQHSLRIRSNMLLETMNRNLVQSFLRNTEAKLNYYFVLLKYMLNYDRVKTRKKTCVNLLFYRMHNDSADHAVFHFFGDVDMFLTYYCRFLVLREYMYLIL